MVVKRVKEKSGKKIDYQFEITGGELNNGDDGRTIQDIDFY